MTQTSPLAPAARRETNGPPCKRCSRRVWDIEARPKSPVRWMIETVFAAPDVWIFQGESGGWPGKHYELWTCAGCGRRVRVSR